MSGKYKAYPEYKDSGVEWLGKVPEHWVTSRLKFLTKQIVDGAHFTPTYSDKGIPFLRVTDIQSKSIDLSKIKYIPSEEHKELIKRCRPEKGDLLLSKNGTIGISKVIDWDWEFSIFVSLCLIKTRKSLSSKFAFYFFQSHEIHEQIFGLIKQSTVINLHLDKIANFYFSTPNEHEQKEITNFLDHETAKIDDLIEKQQRLIALLKEKRQAVISHAVTKGLNPNAPMKDSCVQWLGEVPEHWDVVLLKHVATLQSGIAKGRDVRNKKTIKVPYLRVANVQDGYVNLSNVAEIEIEEHELDRYLLQKGDVLMNEGGDNDKLGRGTVWQAQVDPCIHQNHVFAIRTHSIESEWLALMSQSSYAKFYFFSVSKQSTNLASISSSNIKETRLVVPPEEERFQILTHVQELTGKLDQLQAETQKQIELLKERRTALISAAVTGKIDVRD